MLGHHNTNNEAIGKRNTRLGLRALFLGTPACRFHSPGEGGCRLAQFNLIRLLVTFV